MRRMLEVAAERGGGYPRLRALFVGGDAVAPELVRGMRERFPAAEAFVGYGPTEAAIMCAACRVEGGGEVSHQLVGRPMGNVSLRLLDRRGREVPAGVVGEIYIGGGGGGGGYLNPPGRAGGGFGPPGGGGGYRRGGLGGGGVAPGGRPTEGQGRRAGGGGEGGGGAGRGGRRDIHRRGGRGAGLPQPPRADGGAVRHAGRGAVLQERGPGAVAR